MDGSNNETNEEATYNLLLILPVILSAVWLLIDLFYASWLLAFIANFVINAFLPKGTGVHIGRLKISLLAGRIIFKDLQYYDRDNSVFIVDGYGILRWWKKVPVVNDSTVKCKTCGSRSRAAAGKDSSLVHFQLNGVEYHWYNRKEVYDEWGKPKSGENEAEGSGGLSWVKQLRPSIHCSINKGRILFGNHLMERTLAVYFQHAEGQYRMTEASNTYDELMHLVLWHCDKVQAVFEPSAGYNGPHIDVPLCGEVAGGNGGSDGGYLLLKTDSAEGVYSLDIPGLVPMNDTSSPKFAFDVYLGYNSVINYGSYANRQRINLLQKFFFPNDYTAAPVTRIPQPGERRIYTSFDVSVHVVNNATLNLFFEEKKEIRCLTFRVGGNSSLTINQPWVTKENGYTTSLKGKATDIEVLTSLPYENLGRCQTFDISTDLYFPRIWNAAQKWDMNFSLSCVQGNILFQYVDFFNALLDDWLGDDPPDLLEFVPVDWNIGIDMTDYEIYLHTSSYNWIDITIEGKENSRLAFCGKTGHLAFEFPFVEFLPIEQTVNFTAHGQNIVVRKYLPPSCSSRDAHFLLSTSCKERWRTMDPPQDRTPLCEKKLLRSVSQPLEIVDIQSTTAKSEIGPGMFMEVVSSKPDSFKRTHMRRGSEPALSKTQIQNIPLREIGEMELLREEPEEVDAETEFNEKLLSKPSVPAAATAETNELFPMGCRWETRYDDGWLDIACGPDLTIEFSYKSHNYDPTYFKDGREGERRMVPNQLHVNVEASSVLFRVFGSLAKDLLALRDNFVSEYMYFKTYFSESTSAPDGAMEGSIPRDMTVPPDLSSGPNVPEERFLNVTVDFKLHNIMGELPTHIPEDHTPSDFPLVSGMSELFSIHVDYTESDTCIQLHVEPITVNLPSYISNTSTSSDYSLGYLALNSVDFRCHGFTELLLKERVEYAWMMKLSLGEITGTVSAQQLLPVVDFFQTAANHVLSYGDDFKKPTEAEVIVPRAEPLSEVLKYSLFAVSLAAVDVNIREKDSLLQLKVNRSGAFGSPGFVLDLCNLHNSAQTLAVSLQLHHLAVTAFIATPSNPNVLMECGHADIGTIQGDIGLREPEEAMADRQLQFLKRADSLTRRLWFLWKEGYSCGCCGGCQFQSSSINRQPLPDSHDPLKNLPFETAPPAAIGTLKEGMCSPLIGKPSRHPFKSLKTLQYLHSTLVSYHFSKDNQVPQLQRGVSLEETPTHLPSSSSLPSMNVIPEDAKSQDSDDSYISAKDYFDDELFHSSQNTPKSSVRHSRQASRHSIHPDTPHLNPETLKRRLNLPQVPLSAKNSDLVDHYEKILNSYRCSWKTVKLNKKSGLKDSPPTDPKSASGLIFARSMTPKRSKRRDESHGPKFVLEIPEFTAAVDRLPFSVHGHHSENQSLPLNNQASTLRAEPGEDSAMFSVEVNIGGFNILLSPLLVQVFDRYVECANSFFTTRNVQLLLEALTLEGLGSVESHLQKVKHSSKTSPSIPSSVVSPLAHLSVTMDPSTYGSIQFLQTSKILKPNLGRNRGALEHGSDWRTSLVCLYTTGFQGSGLIHHKSVKPDILDKENATNLQMTLKVAGKCCLPVLQAGLFALSFSSEEEDKKIPVGITSNYSFLDFAVEPSNLLDKKNRSVSITNVAELSMNKFLLTTAAKIIQSEFSSTPILTWSDICDDADTPIKNIGAGDKRDSEQTNNSLAINMSVPSVRLQLGGPEHGIPSASDLCVDSSLVYSLVEAWKPLIEGLVSSVKDFWRNKILRDRQLMLGLVTAAMDKAYRQKCKNPLLTSLSCCIRESVVYSVVQQLWQGLPLATSERISEFPSDYREGVLLQEIVATLLALALRIHVQRSSLSAIPCKGHLSRPSDVSAPGYFSISPSASELAILNASFVNQECENIDYLNLVSEANTKCMLYIRECLLPFFAACNIKMAPQLNKQCHNSLKLSMDYHISLEEAAILVIDGREEMPVDSVDDSVGVVPEFLLDHLCITGSLEHVKESRIVTRPSGHLVTIRSGSASTDKRKHRSNITSKCYLGLDAIATHITLPLLMLSRHTSQSFHHWRKSFQAFRPVAADHHPAQEGSKPLTNLNATTSQAAVTQSQSWMTAKSLVSVLSSMEKKKSVPNVPSSSQSKQATPRSSQRNINVSTYSPSPNYPLSIKALGAISKTYGLEEADVSNSKKRLSGDSTSSFESPNKVTVIVEPQPLEGGSNHGIISSGSQGVEPAEDTTDSAHVFSSDTEAPIQASMATYAKKNLPAKTPSTINPVDYVPEMSPIIEMPNMNEILAIPDNQHEFSVCGLVKIKSLQVSSQVGTLLAMLEVRNISGAVDCRQIPLAENNPNVQKDPADDNKPLLYKFLPTYFSVSSTLQQCCIRVFDSAVSQGDLAVLSANPLELSTSLYYGSAQPAPAYRALFRLPRVELDIKEPPIILHKKFHKYIPTFTAIFNEVIASSSDSSILDEKFFVANTPSGVNVSELHFPPHLPRGSFLFHLVWFQMIVKPLSSLTVKYQLAPVTAQLGTSSIVKFSMNVGQHSLEFTPKESKDELSLRNIPLPAIALKGSVVPRPSSRLPSISAELAMKQVIVDITTDVFNQLLLLQTSFMKELNDLLNMFFNIGEALPQEKLSSINFKQSTESGFELVSLLSSIKLSLQGIKITVSTPTQTALRFSTGNKIEMLITNPSHQPSFLTDSSSNILPIDQLTLHGKVETEISISLGCLQDDSGDDEEDDFVELAYFKTWITIKNTLQQNTSLLTDLGVGSVASLDTFLISIMAPHLYIQSTAVEKAILFWVNCKSVYNFWQNEHKLLNVEVQAATEEFVERITKPSSQIKAPSFDFSKPRLVQITVNDAGACMPLIALPTTPHSSQKGFPALVFTIKDMQVTLNLSKKLGSAGKFSDFCVRFDERFHFRHKTWTVDPRKHKTLNYGEVPNGTYRFCIVNKPREDNGGGEKLFSAFTWHMSGINTNSTTQIGRHISTLVRTLTAIGSDLDESHHQHDTTSSASSQNVSQSSTLPTTRLSSSRRRYSYSFMEEQDVLRALEVDLAKQTRKLQKLRQSGAAPDSLKNEEDNFHKLEIDIARGLRRVFRKGRGMSFQQWGQLLYPRSPIPVSQMRKRSGTLPRRKMVTFEDTEMTPDPVSMKQHPLKERGLSPRTHARHRSDITPDVRRLMKQKDLFLEEELIPTTPNLEAVQEGNENEQLEEELKGTKSKGDSRPSKGFEPLIPSIDIEINVTINVDSGQVVLLSEDISSHDHQRAFGSLGGDSPSMAARRAKQSGPSVHTVLFIPAVEVKAHYQSILGSTYSTAPPSPVKPLLLTQDGAPKEPSSSQQASVDVTRPSMVEIDDRTGLPVKKGILSVTTIISSMPNDLELNPSILDFIEQVVRPINISAQEIETALPADIEEEDDKEESSELPVVVKKSDSQPISFPVDMCFNFQIHPSKIILTCNPHARVRCEITIPIVSFVVSFSLFSKNQYDSLPVAAVSPSKNETKLSQSPPDSSITSQSTVVGQSAAEDITTVNNINVTGCFQTFQLTMFTPNVQSSLLQNQAAAQTADKEVISLVLGQAFIHLSRSSVFVNERPPCKSVDDYKTIEKLKFSMVPHIESLILFYDWRRLNDVTWFRKCWYHTGLVEALFIGKKPTEEPSLPHPSSPYRPAVWSPSSSMEDSSPEPSSTVEGTDAITAEIVVAVSVADMRLSANVAQLMGNAYIQVSHLHGHAHADIKDNELIFLDVDGTLEEFEIDAQGGVVAGNLKVKDTSMSLGSSSQVGCIPEHKASGQIRTIQGHIDYMSAIILLVKGTGLNINVWDSWEGINQDQSEHVAAKIQVCCSFDWSTCQISVHRATAKGMFGIVQRIYDFFIQQKKRSERMIGSLIPAKTTASTLFAAYMAEQKRAEKTRAAEIENPLLEYHHWMWAVKVGSIKLMNALGIQISPDHHDVSLGGFINVSGETISIVCFHGTSFREREWVVFNIDLISAKFSTLAIPGLGSMFLSEDSGSGLMNENKRRICQQVCVVELGNEVSKLSELAAIYRVMAGRGGVPPVSPQEISEWLNYVCINHYLNSIHTAVTKSVGYLKESQKLSIQPVCSLPACSFKLINDHLWPSLRQLEEQIMSGLTESATVECTLVTKFSDGIAVTTTVENYLFLHDLFKCYIDYLDQQNVSFRPPFTTVSQQSSSTPNIDKDTEKTSNCLRKFTCVHWELDPRVVLLATAQWASGHFNPHITWVLETLGFEHARTTIPKYIQRGLMDPLDLGIASIVELLVELSAKKKLRTSDDSSV